MEENRAAVRHSDETITILLDFVEPIVVFRELRNPLAFHGFDEAGAELRIPQDSLNHAQLGCIEEMHEKSSPSKDERPKRRTTIFRFKELVPNTCVRVSEYFLLCLFADSLLRPDSYGSLGW